jgi:hypothetical protein
MREDDSGDREEPGERGEKRRQPDETEIGRYIQQTIQQHFYAIRAGVGEADVSGGQQQKRRRGRPRKQT